MMPCNLIKKYNLQAQQPLPQLQVPPQVPLIQVQSSRLVESELSIQTLERWLMEL